MLEKVLKQNINWLHDRNKGEEGLKGTQANSCISPTRLFIIHVMPFAWKRKKEESKPKKEYTKSQPTKPREEKKGIRENPVE